MNTQQRQPLLPACSGTKRMEEPAAAQITGLDQSSLASQPTPGSQQQLSRNEWEADSSSSDLQKRAVWVNARPVPLQLQSSWPPPSPEANFVPTTIPCRTALLSNHCHPSCTLGADAAAGCESDMAQGDDRFSSQRAGLMDRTSEPGKLS